jgi:hypothetical protein
LDQIKFEQRFDFEFVSKFLMTVAPASAEFGHLAAAIAPPH